MKLTRPQLALLKEIAEHGRQTVSDSYAPATKLVSAGLAEWRYARYGGGTLVPTKAGRTALQEKNNG